MASHLHAKQTVEKSRVSSSSSSQNHSYELLPRQQSYNNPNRDLPSPRASFPFKRVQGGLQGFQSKRNKNELQSNTKQQKKQQNEQKQLLQAIKQLNNHPEIRKQQDSAAPEIAEKNVHEKCKRQIQKLTAQITELQDKLARESEEFELEKKANQIFNQSFMKIRQIMGKKNIKLEGSSMEELVQKLDQAISKKKYEGNVNQILEQQDTKIRQLRAELLKSSQNNINAIFNTEITEAQCLNLQIKKMNGEIMYLKENIDKLKSENKFDASLIYRGPLNSKKDQKTVNIYHHNRSYDTSDDEDLYQKTKKYKKSHSKKKGIRQSRDRSSSDSNKKSRRLSNTQNKVGELIDGYKLLREEYRSLQQTIKQLNNNQSDYKIFFNTLKTEINSSINNQIKQVKQTIKRPSSNSQERKIAKDLQNKLNHLINTLNAPQRASLQKSVDQEHNQDIRTEVQPKILQLQARNQRLQEQNKKLLVENVQLQQRIHRVQVISRQKVREDELNLDLLQSARKKAGRKLQLDELMNASRSDLKEEEIIEQFSVVENSPPVVHTSNINKLHSSQSYHQSHTKSIQIQQLHRKLQMYQQSLREKQLRITELQNTIIDHFQSRAVVMQPLSNSQLKEKYQIYINNLKILLSEAKKENQVLRKEFIKVNELNLSRANQNQDRHSNTVSERTTKNALAQTRLMRRQVKQSNNYDSIQLKLRIEDQIEKIFLTFLQLYQQTFQLVEQDRKPLANTLIGCINMLLKDARTNRNRLFEETIQRQQVKSILYSLGLYQK